MISQPSGFQEDDLPGITSLDHFYSPILTAKLFLHIGRIILGQWSLVPSALYYPVQNWMTRETKRYKRGSDNYCRASVRVQCMLFGRVPKDLRQSYNYSKSPCYIAAVKHPRPATVPLKEKSFSHYWVMLSQENVCEVGQSEVT